MNIFRNNKSSQTDSANMHEHLKAGATWLNYADFLCVWLMVLCPLLQHYRGWIVDARATVMILLAPYLLVRLWIKNEVRFKMVLPIAIYGIFKIVHGGFRISDIGREGLVLLILLAVESGVVNTKRYFKAMTAIAIVASAVIITQYVCYYVFDFHLQVVVTDWFLKSSAQWIGLAQTGAISVTGKPTSFYRPSAFFLEPAHMALFCTPVVLMLLLAPGISKKRLLLAGIVTVGVVASTSGMGIVMCMGLWFLYFVFYCGEGKPSKPIGIGKLQIKGFSAKDIQFKGIDRKWLKIRPFTIKGITMRPINILLIVSMAIVVVLMYLFVDVFRKSINRILFADGGYNAILGRTEVGAYVITHMDVLDLILGERNPGKEANWYMSAFFKVIYDYGMIGFFLSYAFYFISIFKTKREYRWMALLIVGLSFFSVHTHGSAFMQFLCTILLVGRLEAASERDLFPAIRLHPLSIIRKNNEAVNDVEKSE